MKHVSSKLQAASHKLQESGSQKPVLKIDSHQHFWKFDPERDAWISDDMKVIQRDFLPEDIEPYLKQNQFDGCVSVQADQSEAETHFLLELAQQHDFIKGVVGWVDLQSPNLHAKLESLSRYQKLKGFRHIVQAEPDGFLHQPAFRQGIRLLREFNYTYDILIYPRQFEDAIAFVNANPDQYFVLDHLAKPLIRESELHRWSRYMKELAQYPLVYCKLSGMVTEADWQNWKYDDFIPFMEATLEYFGAGRVMYGSDWPVCLVAASYDQQLGIVERFVSTLSASEKEDIMGGNAIRFYNL